MIFVDDAKLANAQKLLNDFQAGTLPSSVSDDDLWLAKKSA